VRIFSIDYRSLALFRIGLGLVMLYCAASFAAVADLFLVPGGALSAEGMRDFHEGSWGWSVNWLSDAAWFQSAILLLTAASAACLIVGWHTRIATIVGWVLITSIINQASPTVGGGDVLLNLLLFWAMFLPLGARWSLDARRSTLPKETSLLSVATAAVLLQMAIMYLFTGFSKCNDVWYSGAALDIGLSNDRLARPLGHLLAGYPWLTSMLTRGTLVAELILPFTLFSPWKFNWCRSVSLLILIAFHIGIESTMVVMLFSYASLVGLLVFIPTAWWETVTLKKLQGALDELFGTQSALPQPQLKKGRKKQRAKHRRAEGLSIKRRLGQSAIIACLLYVFFYNVLVEFASPEFKRSVGAYQRFGELLALKQYWNMFADPSHLCHDVACVARLRDGTRIDLLRDNAKASDRRLRPPKSLEYDKTRLMIFTTTLTYPDHMKHRKEFVEHLIDKYEQTNIDPEKDILDCYLMYYLIGAHPHAEKTPSVVAAHVRRRSS